MEIEKTLILQRKFKQMLSMKLDIEKDCKHNHKNAKQVLKDLKYNQKEIKEVLDFCKQNGGYCDCEILFNVEL